MDTTILVPFEVWQNECKNCEISFALQMILDSGAYFQKQIAEFCPYCGKKIKIQKTEEKKP